MDIIALWGKAVTDSVNKFARGQTEETREDLKQDCFLNILTAEDEINRIERNQGHECATKFVYVLCRNRVLLSTRDEKKHTETIGLDECWAEQIEQPKSPFGVSEQDLDEAVKKLPKLEQHVVRSLYFLAMTERDLAHSLGKTQRWVRTVKDEAFIQLREILESK